MDYLLPEVGAVIIRDEWQVRRKGRRLTYIKEPGAPADTATPFLLHIIPADPDHLPEG